jgi:thiol-disulfide isomerase/thioredoxin
MKNTFIVTIVLLVNVSFSLCMAQSAGRIEVKFQKEKYKAGYTRNIYNIFFSDSIGVPVKYPHSWKHVQIGRVFNEEGFKPVYILKYEDSSDSIKYVVDTNADLDFSIEWPLRFVSNGKAQIAETGIKIIKQDNTPVNEVNYQIRLADEYSYAMVNECRRGEMVFDGNKIEMLIRTAMGHPVYRLSDNTMLYADLNNDSIINEYSKVDAKGKVVMSEQLSLSNPFIINGLKYEAVNLSEDGMNLVLEPVLKDTACSPGFYLPEVAGKDKTGAPVTLKDFRGKKILIQFWSAGCPHCESIRSAANDLIAKSGNRFVFINIPRETEAEVNEYLADHPINSMFLYVDEKIKDKLNPTSSSPLFYIIDEQGKVIFTEPGSNCIKVVEKLLN